MNFGFYLDFILFFFFQNKNFLHNLFKKNSGNLRENS
jgi:hypothetical protein